MARMEHYGVRVFRHGVDFHSDRRWRRKSVFGGRYIVPRKEDKQARTPFRGPIRAFSFASLRRLQFVFANAENEFKTFLTLTYHAAVEEWEDDEARNGRIARRSKKDLNRFLSCLRKEMGAYLWVQEFQARGVIHYHLICEKEIPEDEVKLVWMRAIESLDDSAAMRYGVKVEQVRSVAQMRKYLGNYIGKGRQKKLPPGVDGAGRWWGASRSVELVILEEVVMGTKESEEIGDGEARLIRCLRKFINRVRKFRHPYKGGIIVDWGGGLTERLQRAVKELRAFYGVPDTMLLAKYGWEVEEVGQC